MKFLLVFISAFLLFVLFTPGILGNFLSKGGKNSNVFIHSLVFSILFTLLLSFISMYKGAKLIEGQLRGQAPGSPCGAPTGPKGALRANPPACLSGRCDLRGRIYTCTPPLGAVALGAVGDAGIMNITRSGAAVGSIAPRVACFNNEDCMSGSCDQMGGWLGKLCRPLKEQQGFEADSDVPCNNLWVDYKDHKWLATASCETSANSGTYKDTSFDITSQDVTDLFNCQGNLVHKVGNCHY